VVHCPVKQRGWKGVRRKRERERKQLYRILDKKDIGEIIGDRPSQAAQTGRVDNNVD